MGTKRPLLWSPSCRMKRWSTLKAFTPEPQLWMYVKDPKMVTKKWCFFCVKKRREALCRAPKKTPPKLAHSGPGRFHPTQGLERSYSLEGFEDFNKIISWVFILVFSMFSQMTYFCMQKLSVFFLDLMVALGLAWPFGKGERSCGWLLKGHYVKPWDRPDYHASFHGKPWDSHVKPSTRMFQISSGV